MHQLILLQETNWSLVTTVDRVVFLNVSTVVGDRYDSPATLFPCPELPQLSPLTQLLTPANVALQQQAWFPQNFSWLIVWCLPPSRAHRVVQEVHRLVRHPKSA